jgi:predicted membrane protein
MENNEQLENHENKSVSQSFKKKSLVFGLIVVGLGLAWMLRNFGILSDAAWDVIFSWQMLLIAIGVINISNNSRHPFGWILIAIGGFFLISELYGLPHSFRLIFWPGLLIMIGLILIFGASRFFRRKEFVTSKGQDFIEEVAVFGGGDRYVNSKAFRGGKIVSVFGGSKIDLSKVELGEGDVEIEIVAVFGGSTILVPNDWNVKLEIFHIFGGYSDKRARGQVDYNKTVLIKGVAIFGGGELKSF